MNWGIIVFIGVVGCGLLVWYLYRRSQNNDTDKAEESANDDYEDLLLTGLMLEEIHNDDQASSNDMDSDGYDDGFGGGYDDGGGLG